MLKVFALVGLLCLFSPSQADIPVLLFGNKLPFKVPALKSLANEEFSNLLSSQISEETVTVVFVEPVLKTEDLTCEQANGVTCFENLNKIQGKSYLPRVDAPVKSLYDLNKEQMDVFDVDKLLGYVDKSKVIIFNFEPVTDKTDLVEHDRVIGETYRQLSQQYKNIVLIYTGRQSGDLPKVRKIRAAEAQPKADIDWEVKKDQHFAIVAEKLLKVEKAVGSGAPTETPLTLTGVVSTPSENALSVELQTGAEAIHLKFIQGQGNWELTGATVGDKKVPRFPRYLFAQEKYSLRCGENLEFTIPNDNSYESYTKYIIQNSQFLPVFEADADILFDKEKVVHCTGYFTPGILAGLFVTFLLIIILIIGLGWIMDIRTMDKFDDPKGKTITINASD